MASKKKPATKKPPREDFNEAAFRIIQRATGTRRVRRTAQGTVPDFAGEQGRNDPVVTR